MINRPRERQTPVTGSNGAIFLRVFRTSENRPSVEPLTLITEVTWRSNP